MGVIREGVKFGVLWVTMMIVFEETCRRRWSNLGNALSGIQQHTWGWRNAGVLWVRDGTSVTKRSVVVFCVVSNCGEKSGCPIDASLLSLGTGWVGFFCFFSPVLLTILCVIFASDGM